MLDQKTTKGNYCPTRVAHSTTGQFFDFLSIFDQYGMPSPEAPYIFNGDFVDRGSWGLEIVIVLMSWLLADRGCVFLTRGNHETKLCTER